MGHENWGRCGRAKSYRYNEEWLCRGTVTTDTLAAGTWMHRKEECSPRGAQSFGASRMASKTGSTRMRECCSALDSHSGTSQALRRALHARKYEDVWRLCNNYFWSPFFAVKDWKIEDLTARSGKLKFLSLKRSIEDPSIEPNRIFRDGGQGPPGAGF